MKFNTGLRPDKITDGVIHVAHARRKICLYRFVTALPLIKCLEQVKLHKLLLTCTTICEVQSRIRIQAASKTSNFTKLIVD